MNVIETADIQLAAYAMARGGGLRVIDRTEGRLYRLEGHGIELAEIDYAHFGPCGVSPARLERLAEVLRTVSRRRL